MRQPADRTAASAGWGQCEQVSSLACAQMGANVLAIHFNTARVNLKIRTHSVGEVDVPAGPQIRTSCMHVTPTYILTHCIIGLMGWLQITCMTVCGGGR